MKRQVREKLSMRVRIYKDPLNDEHRFELALPEINVEVKVRGFDLRELVRQAAIDCVASLGRNGYEVSLQEVLDAIEKSLENAVKHATVERVLN